MNIKMMQSRLSYQVEPIELWNIVFIELLIANIVAVTSFIIKENIFLPDLSL